MSNEVKRNTIEIAGRTHESVVDRALEAVKDALLASYTDVTNIKFVSPDGEKNIFEVALENGLKLWITVDVVDNPEWSKGA